MSLSPQTEHFLLQSSISDASERPMRARPYRQRRRTAALLRIALALVVLAWIAASRF